MLLVLIVLIPIALLILVPVGVAASGRLKKIGVKLRIPWIGEIEYSLETTPTPRAIDAVPTADSRVVPNDTVENKAIVNNMVESNMIENNYLGALPTAPAPAGGELLLLAARPPEGAADHGRRDGDAAARGAAPDPAHGAGDPT